MSPTASEIMEVVTANPYLTTEEIERRLAHKRYSHDNTNRRYIGYRLSMLRRAGLVAHTDERPCRWWAL